SARPGEDHRTIRLHVWLAQPELHAAHHARAGPGHPDGAGTPDRGRRARCRLRRAGQLHRRHQRSGSGVRTLSRDLRCVMQPFTRARIVALTVSALVVLGLVALRFATGTPAVSVPAGAHAGQLTLSQCTYPTQHGSYAADCGTLVVPENRADPRSRL